MSSGYGGPHAGFFAVRDMGNLKRMLPGRMVGVTRQVQKDALTVKLWVTVIPLNSNKFSNWRRTCHGSKLTNSLGGTTLTNFLGKKKQHELSSRT